MSLRDGLRLIDSIRYANLAQPARDSSAYEISLPTLAPGYRYSIQPRSSDANEVRDVLVEQEHLPTWLRPPSRILDAGAGTGLTSADYLSRFPDATVVAVEPQSGFDRRIRHACAPWSDRLVVVPDALWSVDGEILELGGRRSFSVGAALTAAFVPENRPDDYETKPVHTVSLARLCATYGPFDFAKIDVEGAEREVLLAAETWAASVDSLTVELHPGRTGFGIAEATAALESVGYEVIPFKTDARRPVIHARRPSQV